MLDLVFSRSQRQKRIQGGVCSAITGACEDGPTFWDGRLFFATSEFPQSFAYAFRNYWPPIVGSSRYGFHRVSAPHFLIVGVYENGSNRLLLAVEVALLLCRPKRLYPRPSLPLTVSAQVSSRSSSSAFCFPGNSERGRRTRNMCMRSPGRPMRGLDHPPSGCHEAALAGERLPRRSYGGDAGNGSSRNG
jgi:hypothetical protein